MPILDGAMVRSTILDLAVVGQRLGFLTAITDIPMVIAITMMMLE